MLSFFAKSLGIGKDPELSKAPEFVVPPNLGQPPGDSTPALLAEQLNEKQDMVGATQTLSKTMPQNKSVKWAVESCKKVEPALKGPDLDAFKAAQAYSSNPTAATREAAAVAAAKTDFQGPGAWAAKAAGVADTPGAAPVPGANSLVPHCVFGAVALAVVLASKKPSDTPPPPAAPPSPEVPKIPAAELPKFEPPAPKSPEANKTAHAYKPFIEEGLKIASGS